MKIEKQIIQKLSETLQPLFLEVTNESHKHRVPPGSESHFKVTVVSAEFEGMPLVKRHKRIFQILEEELAGPVHALAVHATEPSKWDKSTQSFETPDCSKKNIS